MPPQTRGCKLTISLIPVSFPVGSFGLEEGRGGGIRAPVVSGVVGLFGAVITQKQVFDWLEERKERIWKQIHDLCTHTVQFFFSNHASYMQSGGGQTQKLHQCLG